MVVYVLSLIGTRTVMIAGPWWPGVWLKLGIVAAILGLLGAQGSLPPVAVAGALAGVLVLVVIADRALIRART